MASFKISDNCPDGALLGDSSASLWATHGATPCGQQTAPSELVAGDSTTTILTAVNTIRTALINKGIIV